MNIFKRAFILLFLVGSFILKADDLLFKLSGGELNENMVGVKKLSEKEMREVRGGYHVRFKKDDPNFQLYAVGIYTADEVPYMLSDRGLCGIDIDKCVNPSARRLVDWKQVGDNSLDFFPVYKVQMRRIKTRFQTYPLFTYATGVMDHTGQIYLFDSTRSSMLLNYNSVIREIASAYKQIMERYLERLQ